MTDTEEQPELHFWTHAELEEQNPTSPEELERLRAQVRFLKTQPQPEQRSKEWYDMRKGMTTASDFGAILGMNKYSKPEEVLNKKCGIGPKFTGNAATRWGTRFEPVADMIYKNRNTGVVLDEFGLIQHPRHTYIGASPDGITEDGIMVEIKCPPSRKITGTVMDSYWAQIQGQLEVCRLERCDFLECKFLEYPNEAAYFADTDQPERGVILEFKKGDELDSKKYVYSEMAITQEEYEQWKATETEQFIAANPDYRLFETSFWYLDHVSCVPVYRDREWWDTVALPGLTKFWSQVLHYRKPENKAELIRANAQRKRPKRTWSTQNYEPKPMLTGYAFVDSDDDS